MTEPKVSNEVAEQDFQRFADMARLKLDRVRNENERRDLGEDRQYFIEEVMDGRIVVDENGYPTVLTESEELPEVKFTRRPRVTGLRAMDKCKKENENGKMIAMMADTLGIAPAKFNTLDTVDFENVSLVFGLFLGNRG